MGSFAQEWDAAWAATSINASALANAGSLTTAALSNDQKTATEVSVEIAYGGTVNEGVKVYVLRDVDGTNFEAVADLPYGFELPRAASTTFRRSFTVPAGEVSAFKIHLTNNSGASVTATVRTRQAVGVTA